MNTRNKKNIGILLAAIMVASVFAVVAPLGIADDMEARCSNIYVTPADDIGGRSTSYWVNFTLDETIYNCTNITIAEAHRVPPTSRPYFDFSTATLNRTLGSGPNLEDYGYDIDHNGITIHVNSTTGNITGNVNVSLDSVINGGAGDRQFVVTIWNATNPYSNPIEEEVSHWFRLFARLIAPVEDQCIGGTFNFSWEDHPSSCDWKLTITKKATGEEKYHHSFSVLHGVVDTTTFEDDCQNFTVKLCPEQTGCVDVFIDEVNITIDNIDPCIDCVSTSDEPYGRVNSLWYNYTDITLNVSACDVCCGIENVTANISAVSDKDVEQFTGPLNSAGNICTLDPEECEGFYYELDIDAGDLEPSDVVDIPVVARDKATTINNTAECTLTFGVDMRAPEKVDDVVCDNTEAGAITIQWDEGEDLPQPPNPSGIDYYIIYFTKINRETNVTVDEGVLTTTASTSYLFNPATAGVAKYCFNYTFKVKAVDNAGNVGVYSDPTNQQHLKPGIPDQVDITHPLEGGVVIACTAKDEDYIKATIKDQFGVPVGGTNFEVHIAATKGVVCPWKIAPIPDDGNVTSGYKAPQWVPDCEPVAINVSLWNSTDGTYINSSIVNIEICPKQAKNISITADPTMIMAGAGAVNKSTITVQLIDVNDYAVHLTGVDIVVTTNAGTFENGEQSISGYTNETGTFIATLTSSKTPTLATVTADANSHWWIRTVDVTFAGFGSYDIPLCEGWNLISLPLVPEDSDAGIVLTGIAGELDFAFAYNAFTGNWSFGAFIPPDTWTGDLYTMRVQEGYWLYMNESATLTVTGYTVMPPPFTPPTFWVNAGWNLVGYYVIPPDKVTTAENYFGDVIVRYNMLGYDCESQGYFAVGANDNLESGKGYWMNARTIGEITPKEWL